jgi:hypothetical protein
MPRLSGAFEFGDAHFLARGHARPGALVDTGSMDPALERVRWGPELLTDPRARTTPATGHVHWNRQRATADAMGQAKDEVFAGMFEMDVYDALEIAPIGEGVALR